MTKQISITISEKLSTEYKNELWRRGYKLSTRIQRLIERDLEEIKNGSY